MCSGVSSLGGSPLPPGWLPAIELGVLLQLLQVDKLPLKAFDAAVQNVGDQLIRRASDTKIVTNSGVVPANKAPASMDMQAGEAVPEWARRRVPVYGRVNARPLAPGWCFRAVGPARLERATSCSGGASAR